MLRRPANGATVSFSMKPAKGPWGGSSAFVTQLSRHLKARGYRVRYDLEGDIDLVVLIDPRIDKLKPYAHEQIAEYRRKHPGVKVLHRVNECDQRKDTGFMDDLLREASEVADMTVFISDWLRAYFVERGFDPERPHRVVYNGADPAIFHPLGKARWQRGREPLRLITHHWSNHMLKGFDVYEQVDHLIADGGLKDVHLMVMGRWPDSIQWKAAELISSRRGAAMAEVLRSAHAYLTASRWEPCGMHHVEGAQCGLPLIYHEDGGGIVEAGQRYGIGFREDPARAIQSFMQDYDTYQQRLLRSIPSGDRMCLDYLDAIQELLAFRDA